MTWKETFKTFIVELLLFIWDYRSYWLANASSVQFNARVACRWGGWGGGLAKRRGCMQLEGRWCGVWNVVVRCAAVANGLG